MRDVSLVYSMFLCQQIFVSLRESGVGMEMVSSVAVLLYRRAYLGWRREFLAMEVRRLNNLTIHWHLLTRLRHQG